MCCFKIIQSKNNSKKIYIYSYNWKWLNTPADYEPNHKKNYPSISTLNANYKHHISLQSVYSTNFVTWINEQTIWWPLPVSFKLMFVWSKSVFINWHCNFTDDDTPLHALKHFADFYILQQRLMLKYFLKRSHGQDMMSEDYFYL